ncbi:unnamed protein product [marine sediment metagenome]|uniref:Uncharacterized protein n=1 Tax=marine sediment metagenome TaxID=412755 RepID=X1ARU3_9ZZZZ
MNQEIKRVIESYQSIIDLEEENEVMHLIADLQELFSEKDKVKHTCYKCGSESWFKVNLETYVVSINDLICDDCNSIEVE